MTQTTLTSAKHVGLALGGGASLGAAHVGVLRALEEAGVRVSCLAGTSIGAFVAALYAFETPVEAIDAIARDLQWFQVAGLRLSKLGLLSHSKLGALLEEHVGSVKIEDAPVPLAIVATDIGSGERVVLRSGPVVDAVLASSAVPVLFQPVAIDDRLLVDGGLVDNLPSGVVRDLGADFVIGSSLWMASEPREVTNLVDVSLQALRITIGDRELEARHQSDLVIAPDLSNFSPANTRRSAELIEAGYSAAKAALTSV